ncbi:probable ATP-dependent RNA helicase DDX28 isoform X1 [Bombus impatiens]|uniref:RNA helicase n=1 Tax=Bombus impatiens TaxID=132113 RepID=A0A6P3DUA4_BOMIM|nr:probable ATP-dependent RNA helicase DDX28 isoform X1 [Bombus impatiens]
MLFQFCHVGCKTKINATFLNVTRHYARAVVKIRRKGNDVANNEVKREKTKTPIIKCKKQMYDFYEGDKFSKEKPILASQSWKNRKSKGDHFFIYPYNNDVVETNEEVGSETFQDLDVNASLCNNLEDLNIYEPLEIQKLGIPKIFQECNVLIAAETGCGKTLAYLLPLITKIVLWKQKEEQRSINTPLGLIVTPSRELTVQIGLQLIKLSKHLNIKTKIVTGGRTKRIISDPPVGNIDILVCSFGVVSKLTTFGVYDLAFVRFVVLDEADSLFHSSFETKLKIFLRRIPIGYHQYDTTENEFPKTAQLVLVSASIPSGLKTVLSDIININSLEHVTTEKLHRILIPQKFVRLIPSQKPIELVKYVKSKVLNKQRVIVFSNRNSTSYWISLFLHECGVKVTNLNGDMPLHVRRGKYGEFLNGKTMVLSTTNGGSQGLDTIMVNHILNYDFPLDTSSYIHRCGRAGRIGTIGVSRVTNFISKPSEIVVVQKIERAVRKMKPIPVFNLLDRKDEKEEETEYDFTEEMIENLDEVENIPY